MSADLDCSNKDCRGYFSASAWLERSPDEWVLDCPECGEPIEPGPGTHLSDFYELIVEARVAILEEMKRAAIEATVCLYIDDRIDEERAKL